MNPIISLEKICKKYTMGDQKTEALKDINLKVEKGEFVAIMGPSGSGKSSLMHILGLLDVSTSGTYILNDQDVSKLNKNQQAEIRNREIGFVFQQFNLLPRTCVLENVLLPSVYGNVKDVQKKARKIIAEIGLNDRVNNLSNQLSGGQIQRVAIARALLMEPSIILADEPTGNLDSKTSHEIMKLLSDINKKQGATIVLITHEADIAEFAERTINLKDGEIVNQPARRS